MEQKHVSNDSARDQLLPLSAKYPLFVAENLGAEEDGFTDHIFFTLHDPLSKYQCQIPELLGRRIRGYYHGWVILSDHPQNVMWSLWNPVTSNMIHLPPLILKDGDSISVGQCCLLAPPDDPTSILLLTRTNKPTFVFCRLDSRRKKLIWTEIAYAEQLQKITGEDGFLSSLACCNKKLYALNVDNYFGEMVIQVNIVDKGEEVLIKLLLLGPSPFPSSYIGCDRTHFLKGSCTELFYITVAFLEGSLLGAYCFKLDMTSLRSEDIERFKDFDMTGKDVKEEVDYSDLEMSRKMWEGMVDLKDAMFFMDLAGDRSVYYRPAIASEVGGNIYIRDKMGQIMYSCNVKNNTISLSSLPSRVLPTSHVSLWECRLEDGHGEAKCTIDPKPEEDQRVVRSVTHNEVEFDGWNLLNLPVDILETIMEHCVGVEYMNFRATCKHCHLAAPLIKWSTKTSIRKLQDYSLVSPWLMVADKNQGIMTFTDPLLGNSYFNKTLELLKVDFIIHCSRFGWLLLEGYSFEGLYFFNPLTSDLRMLPEVDDVLKSLSFSAPPTSPDCMVVGFSESDDWNVFIHFVAREPSWRQLSLGVGPYSIHSPTFLGRDLYALRNEGDLIGFKDLGKEHNSWTLVEAKAPVSCCKSPAKYFLMNCDQDLLLVVVGEFGERVEVFKLDDSKQEWVKVNDVGKHTIYICGITCLCVEAKSMEMENKIYFPRLHSKNNKIVFYSLETCSYQTSHGDNIQERLRDFIGTTYHLSPHLLWIEPSWSS
ncbi:hypothetical protein Tco_0973789 [Tanacetum coccineum]|uniref:F-box domain-containing protein n=1 Tax=Tanacetum coccineum TaxID=301880 RepID=A0ABQ5E9S0_9ASTR